MKEIRVIGINEAETELNRITGEYAVIYLSEKTRDIPESLSTNEKRNEILNLAVDEECLDFNISQADSIIRLCERSFNIDTILVVHNDRYNAALNIAYEIAQCYDLDLECDTEPENEYVRRQIRAKYTQISNSLLHILEPMDYCKRMLKIMFDQITDIITGKRIDGFGSVDFFSYRQCTVILKSGIKLLFHLETNLENVVIPDMDDIEYVQFYAVPEIADPSSFKGNDKGYFGGGEKEDCYHELKYGFGSNGNYIEDCYYEMYDYYGSKYGYNSIDGITASEKPIPEKYKNYRTIQREYYEFYKPDTKVQEYYDPGMKGAFLGMKTAEEYLAEKNGYVPKFYQLPRRFIEGYRCIITHEYINHLAQFIRMMRENDLWNGNELEKACIYAAYLYTGSLINLGHCENMTVLRYIFENYPNREAVHELEKLWNIDKYVPTTENDPVNMLCLAVYALIETVRPYNGRPVPGELYEKCLDKAYELTEGRPELNNAVIMTGAFAGVYCQRF